MESAITTTKSHGKTIYLVCSPSGDMCHYTPCYYEAIHFATIYNEYCLSWNIY